MAKDRTPAPRRAGGSSAAGRPGGKGRTRPPTQVVTAQRRPWGLIAAALAVLIFAVGAISYAVVKVNQAEANEVQSPDEIEGVETFDDPSATHVVEPVDYPQSPPVGGDHDGVWADCTGTVYDVDIRHENAVHGLEHGAVWITYNPDQVSEEDITQLESLVDGVGGRMLSPFEGQDSPISVQSWSNQLKVESATDPRIEQYADFFTSNAEYAPEPGATCESPDFLAAPRLEVEDGQAPAGDPAAPSSGSPEATQPSESAEPSETPAS